MSSTFVHRRIKAYMCDIPTLSCDFMLGSTYDSKTRFWFDSTKSPGFHVSRNFLTPNAPYKEAISRRYSNQLKMARIRCLLAIITLTIATITSSYAQYAIEGIAVPDGKISHL